jgi:hypothetical protein
VSCGPTIGQVAHAFDHLPLGWPAVFRQTTALRPRQGSPDRHTAAAGPLVAAWPRPMSTTAVTVGLLHRLRLTRVTHVCQADPDLIVRPGKRGPAFALTVPAG